MNHGLVDVFAYQEALLIEAAFGIAFLFMIWVGFRRWLQQKERLGRLNAEQTAQYDARIERVETQLQRIEQSLTGGADQAAAQIDAARASPPLPRTPKPDRV